MAEKTGVEFFEEWQIGAFVLIGCAVVAVVVGVAVGMLTRPIGFLPGFVAGGVLAFLVYSYFRYGR
jgi:hypothetical protein